MQSDNQINQLSGSGTTPLFSSHPLSRPVKAQLEVSGLCVRRLLYHDLALCSFLCATVARIHSTKLRVLQKERGDERQEGQRLKKDGRGYGWNEEGCGLLL